MSSNIKKEIYLCNGMYDIYSDGRVYSHINTMIKSFDVKRGDKQWQVA